VGSRSNKGKNLNKYGIIRHSVTMYKDDRQSFGGPAMATRIDDLNNMNNAMHNKILSTHGYHH